MSRLALACFAWSVCTLIAASSSYAGWLSTIQASAPLNWYRLDETIGNTAIDYGSGGLHGTYGSGAENPVRGALGLVGGAIELDGDRDAIRLGGSALTGDWTAEFVVKRTGTKLSSILIRGAPFALPTSALKLEQYPDRRQLGFTEFAVGDFTFNPAVATLLDEWHHVVYVKTSSGTTLYLDGELGGANTATVSLSRDHLGSYADSETPLAVLDEVVLYNRALSPQEIEAHALAVPEPATVVLLLLAVPGMVAAIRHRHRGVG
jgi:hypothetical protein